MIRIINSVNSVVWGPPMLLLFFITGLRFSIKGRFFQITKLKANTTTFLHSIINNKDENGLSQFAAFCSVLGACIGTGNIVGVATAINCGGPGVVFWMVLSALLSMAIAYAENFLGSKYTNNSISDKVTGVFAYMENGLKMRYTSKIYALLSLISSFGMGNMTQSNSLADTIKITFNIPVILTAIVVCITVYIIVNGGLKRIAKIQTLIIPVASIFYFFISFCVIAKHKNKIIPTIKEIFSCAFSFKTLKGFNAYTALRYGFARGIFSNEAGLGSATLLHSQVKTNNYKAQGISAMTEVFIDTIVMCSITAIVILISSNIYNPSLFGAGLALNAYSSIGKLGKYGVSLLTTIFAFTSLISCSFYGEKSSGYLFNKTNTKVFRIIYAGVAFLGCVNPPKIIWEIADICNGLMAIPNLFAINYLNKEVEYQER